jgi:hypothetical protein
MIALSPGLSKPGMTAGGFGFTPPDSTGAIGPNNYVEMANSRIAVYDRNLNLVSSSTLQNFAGQASSALCDVQIQWDPSANRWLYAFLYCGSDPNLQGFFLGWSMTSDPSNLTGGGWCQFAYSTGAFLLDFPKLGHNSNYMIVGGNFYANPTTTTPSFVTATIAWVPLPANGDTTCTLPSLVSNTANPLKNGDGVTDTFTPVPVNTDSAAPNGYIVSAYDPAGNTGAPGPKSRVAVWHLDSAGVLHADSDLAVNTYVTPSSARQPGTLDVLDTLDGRLTQAVGDPSTGIYTQHTVAGPGGRSEVDWYEFTVSGLNLVLAQQGSIASPTDWVFNAAISPRFDGLGAAIVYNRSSQNTYPLIAAQIRYQATPPNTMAAGELVIMTSSNPDTDFSCIAPYGPPCRWGDYAGATPDPAQPTLVWGTSEINTGSGPAPGWADANFALAPSPEAPTNVRALSARPNAARVSWTPSASDPSAPPTSYTVRAYVGGAGIFQTTVVAPTTTLYFTGLTFGVTYTFTVTANSAAGPSLESAHSNAVTFVDTAAAQSTLASPPPRSPAAQSTPVASSPPRV